MASSGNKYIVTTYGGDSYEVTATRIEIDPTNSNRVTFYKGSGENEVQIGQENNTSSCRPKNA